MLIVIYIIFITINYYRGLYTSIIDSLEIWLFKVLPPLFTMYFIQALLLQTKAMSLIILILKPIRLLFKFETDNAFSLFIMSIFISNPVSIELGIEYYKNKLITKHDLDTLIKCSSFINPLFVFSIVKDNNLSVLIYLSHIVPNLLLALILTRKNVMRNDSFTPHSANFFNQMNQFPKICLIIATNMALFSIIIFSLSLLDIPIILLPFLELSQGVVLLKSLNKIYLIPSLLSFNGLCMHFQVYTISKGIVSKKVFFLFRLVSSILSYSLFIIILLFL